MYVIYLIQFYYFPLIVLFLSLPLTKFIKTLALVYQSFGEPNFNNERALGYFTNSIITKISAISALRSAKLEVAIGLIK